MKRSQPYRLGAWIALVLLLVGNLVPALAFSGVWLCADGSVCPWMNGASSAKRDGSASPACCKAPTARCCPSGTVSQHILKGTASQPTQGPCRFATSERIHEPLHLIRADRLTDLFDWAALLPPLEDLFSATAETWPDFPLPSPTHLPLPLPLTATASRAPPLG